VFRVVFENFYLNKELFYLINHNRHPFEDIKECRELLRAREFDGNYRLYMYEP